MRSIDDIVPDVGESERWEDYIGKAQVVYGWRGPFKGPKGEFYVVQAWVWGKGRVVWRTGAQEVVAQLKAVEELGAWRFAAVINVEKAKNSGNEFAILRSPAKEVIAQLDSRAPESWLEEPVPGPGRSGTDSAPDQAPAGDVPAQEPADQGEPDPKRGNLTPMEYAYRQQTIQEIVQPRRIPWSVVKSKMLEVHPDAEKLFELTHGEFSKLCDKLRAGA